MKRKFLNQASMRITHGLMDKQVIQRNRNDVCEVTLQGYAVCAGAIEIRAVEKESSTCVEGFDFKSIANILQGKFAISLNGIPVGGPYDISIRLVSEYGEIIDELLKKDVLVGDVWILAGQSNMQGIGYLKYAAKPDRFVRAFYMDDRWDIANDPIHNVCEAKDRIHKDLLGDGLSDYPTHIGTGPGVAFGQKMYELTGIPQGLIACSHGGASMKQWTPSLKDEKGSSLYGAMIRRVHKNGRRVAGVIWYQGCSDTEDKESVRLYSKRTTELVNSVRKDLDEIDLPFVVAQIAGVYEATTVQSVRNINYWCSIREQQRLLSDAIHILATVPTIDLSFDDFIHLSGYDQHRLGARFAQAMLALCCEKKDYKLPIEVDSIELKPNKINNNMDIEVHYGNIVGELQASGKPTGFVLVQENGKVFNGIYRVDIEVTDVILRTSICPPMNGQMQLYYGYGLSPYCNITDSQDRSLPAFGPLDVKIS